MAATLKCDTIQNASSTNPNITLDGSANATVGGTLVMGSSFKRNRIINGNMAIDQRNAGASVTLADSTYYLDRWRGVATQTSKATVVQSSVAPTDFANSILITSSSSYAVLTGDIFSIQQRIEGFNFYDLNFGTANAKTITMSFWVRSSLTGTFGGAILNSAQNRSYPFSYSISSANTWEQKSVVISGDTTGTWIGSTNGIGAIVNFGLGGGSTYSGTAGAWTGSAIYTVTGATSVVGTNGATFYITGVQLEVGSVATPYERQIYSEQLAQCQRYLPAFNSTGTNTYIASCVATSTTNARVFVPFMTQVRTPPTGISVSSASHLGFTGTVNATASAVAIVGVTQPNNCGAFDLTTTGLTAGQAGAAYFNNASGQLLFTGCEL